LQPSTSELSSQALLVDSTLTVRLRDCSALTIGQYVIVIPSERLVIVRLGRSPNWPPEADGVFQLVSDVVAAIGGMGHLAGN
jgi:hypothetical protein